MKTKIIKIDIGSTNWEEQLDFAAKILKTGGLVAFPTETVYGLGANALDEKAVMGIYAAKGRPSDNPLIVHIADKKDVESLVVSVPEKARKLMETCWPGPLTLVMRKSDKIPSIITAGLDTVAIRMPSHPIALALIKKAGVPVAAPSANTSGRPSPTLAKHVIDDLADKVDVIIDGGSAKVGVESTVLDVTAEIPVILRPGGITVETLRQIIGEVALTPGTSTNDASFIPRSPGMKYRHYAPRAVLLLFNGRPDRVAAEISKRSELYMKEGNRVGILTTDETISSYEDAIYSNCKLISLGSRRNPESLAANLFRCLREFDDISVDVILAEMPEADGIGYAVVNRLMKAAGGKAIKV